MRIELPDLPETSTLTSQEIRLELACALYARGRIGKVAGAELAGVDFVTFQRSLGERGVASYTEEMLVNDGHTLKRLFPS